MAARGQPGFQISPSTQVQTSGLNFDFGFTERRCQLTVVSGAQAGKSVEINKPQFTVGKGDECDLVIADATVSRQHFTIDQQAGAYVIRDNASTNGTWIDQFRIREAYLRPGVMVRAGQVQLKLEPLFKPIDIAPYSEDRFGSLVGHSVRMRQIFTMLERVAKTDATVVIFGETGTGKSAIAQAIHEGSSRKSGPFITVDCGAIAENLIESELFGHEKGAFTGADKQRKGALERAHGGTLFIDELVDLRLDLQPRLLRVLEEREVRRVGSNDPIKLDVRIIAASRFDLWREVEAKKFREDLYFRLAVFTIPLPSLRERKEDIPLLAQSFARTIKGGDRLLMRMTPQVLDKLSTHAFPGNVRELRNVIERAIYMDSDPTDMLGPLGGIPDRGALGAMPGGTPFASGSLPPGALPTNPNATAPFASPFHNVPPASMSGQPVSPPRTPAPMGGIFAPQTPAAAFAQAAASSAPMQAQSSMPLPRGAGATFGDETAPVPVPVTSDAGVPLLADCTLPFKDAKEKLLEQFEGEYFRRLIQRAGGNASAIARLAGIDRKHVYTLAKKHNLDLKAGKRGDDDE